MSHHSYQLPKKLWGAVPGPRVKDLSDTWGEELLNHEKESSSDFNRQSTRGKKMNNAHDVDENDPIHTKMMSSKLCLKHLGSATPGDLT